MLSVVIDEDTAEVLSELNEVPASATVELPSPTRSIPPVVASDGGVGDGEDCPEGPLDALDAGNAWEDNVENDGVLVALLAFGELDALVVDCLDEVIAGGETSTALGLPKFRWGIPRCADRIPILRV